MFKLFSKKTTVSGLLGLSVSDERVLAAHLTQGSGADEYPTLRNCSHQALDSAGQAREVLAALVDSMDINGLGCNFVLSPRDYNLYLIEAPAVEAAEMSSAVRWKIKDLLDMPAEDAVVDIFPVPEDAFQGRAKMLYAVAAQKSRIQSVIELVDKAGLKLQSIDIPELAMRNISNALLRDEHGLAFMDLRKTGSTMNLSKNGQLYLTRKINTALDSNVMHSRDWETQRDRLVLEIQRSLDYYESQMGQNPISQIVLAPRALDSHAMAESLNSVMSVKVSVADLSGCMNISDTVDAETQHMCLLAIGGALRNEKAVRE